MKGRLMRRTLVAAIAGAAFAAVASTAIADQYFHTSHAAVSPIGAAPLKSGFVNDIHTNGATIGAQERYQLNGAEPNTAYTVALHISQTDPTCAVVNAVFPTETFTTNKAGNGEAGHTFFQTGPWPPTTPPTLRTVYIRWVFSDAAGPEYQTDCVPVVVGG
jgi:hypothetical protein